MLKLKAVFRQLFDHRILYTIIVLFLQPPRSVNCSIKVVGIVHHAIEIDPPLMQVRKHHKVVWLLELLVSCQVNESVIPYAV